MNKTRVLVTYSWCRTAYTVIECLAKAGYDVYACDYSPWSMGRFSKFTKGFDRVSHPFKEPDNFVEDIRKIVKKRRINVLLPSHEDSLPIAAERHGFRKDLIILCPQHEALKIALDKNAVSDLARKSGIPVPRKAAPSSHENLDQCLSTFRFPLIIKTRRGNSGKGVFLAHSLREAKEIFLNTTERFSLPPHSLPIFQEFIGGDLYGTCFLAKDGRLKAFFAEKYLRWKESKFGTSVLREPSRWPLLRTYTERFVHELGWSGIGHLDFAASEDGSEAYLLEMNPRFWGAVNLAVKNGYNFPLGLISMAERGEPAPAAFSPLKKEVKSLWIVGEIIAGLSEFRHGRLTALLESLSRIVFHGENTTFDDFRWTDPLPFIAEMVYYGSHFFKSGYDVNPVDVEMIG
jgi:predicted ATP-grasp superfamily ATP-dependent carboligase